MNENQKVVFKYLKHAYSSRSTYPIFLIVKFNELNTFRVLPKNVKGAYDALDDVEEAQVIIKFGKWVLKNA